MTKGRDLPKVRRSHVWPYVDRGRRVCGPRRMASVATAQLGRVDAHPLCPLSQRLRGKERRSAQSSFLCSLLADGTPKKNLAGWKSHHPHLQKGPDGTMKKFGAGWKSGFHFTEPLRSRFIHVLIDEWFYSRICGFIHARNPFFLYRKKRNYVNEYPCCSFKRLRELIP